jgi:16S rRNA (uracil1498-N3)-methyltransferase
MPPRFYCPLLSTAGSVTLPEGEAHHLARVLRVAEGDVVELFNGRGLVGHGVVGRIQKHQVECTVDQVQHEPKSVPELVIATAVPKGERFDWLVEKAVELGVDRLVPLITARSVVDPREGKLDRLRQTVVAACKQCHRSHLMELSSVTDFQQLIHETGGEFVVIADPAGVPLAKIQPNRQSASGLVFVVGPEGGLTDGERSWAREQEARFVSLGRNILRVETAVLALAAWGNLQREIAG